MRAESTPFAAIAGAAIRHSATSLFVMCFSSSLGGGGQVVELDDRVGLGPYTELARVGEGRVVRIDDLLALVEDLDVVADHLHRQVMPDTRLDLPIPSLESYALALDDAIQVDVVFERVRAGDVVVVRVLEPPDDSAALVALSRERLALHGQAKVLQLRAGVRDRESVVGRVAVGLRAQVVAARRTAGCSCDPIHRPALPGQRELESLGRLSGRIRVEVEGGHRLLRDRRRAEQDPGERDCALRSHASSARARSGRLRLKYS